MPYIINSERIIHETIDDETILIDTVTGSYFSLLGVAAQIWRWLAEGAAVDAISTSLTGLVGASTNVADEVAAFVARLAADELIVPCEQADETLASVTLATTYAAPRLTRYDDVRSLLVVDPIHDADDRGWPHQA